MPLIPWNRPRGALHSLAHWSEIDEGARSLLLLSDRTLYVLQNLVGLDVGMRSRWIAHQNDLGYYPPEPGSEDDETFLVAVALAQEELIPMPQWQTGLFWSETDIAGSGDPQNLYWQPDDDSLEYRLDAIVLSIANRVPTNLVIGVGRNNENYVRLADCSGSPKQIIFCQPNLEMPGIDVVLRGQIYGSQNGDSLNMSMYYSQRVPLIGG